MNKYLKLTTIAVAGLVLTGVLILGAGCQPPKSPAPDQKGRFQVYATGNGTFLVDTQTGDSWVQINTVWVTTPKTTLPPEIYTALLNQAFRVVGGTQTNGGTPTPSGTPTPQPPPPEPRTGN
jgi:hypothetical protein